MGGRVLMTEAAIRKALVGKTIESVEVKEYDDDPSAGVAKGADLVTIWFQGGGRVILGGVELSDGSAVEAVYYPRRRSKREGGAR